MGEQTMCVPGARRRENKWRAVLRRNAHLCLWVAVILCVAGMLGYGVVKALRQKGDADTVSQKGVTIIPFLHKEK